MTGRAAFGDFLRLAHRDLDPGALTDGTAAGENLEEVIRALARLVTVMRRYTQDLTATLPEITPRAQQVRSPSADACVQANEALATVARFLALRNPVLRPAVITRPSAQARRLERAAASLRMGRDLLHTHFSVDAAGSRRPRSEWAPAITSEVVTWALLTEIARVARKAADQCSALALSQSANVAGDSQARQRLNAACQWLWVLEASVRTAHERAPTGSAGTELLSAIPVNALPPRFVLRGGEPVTVLCESAISSAERVRHLAWAAADRAASRNVTVASLRQVAENSTVTSHNCAGLLHLAATRVAQAGHAEASGRLAAAAEAARRARGTWLRTAREVARIRTATPGLVSPAAAEAAELASWTGRLAYADPQWSPSDGPDRALRPPETVAMEDLPQVIAAAHHACETLTGLARAEHDQVRAAAIAGRILVPTRSLPDDYDIPYPFARAPRERVVSLLNSYGEAAQASRRAADIVGGVAEMIHAPSRTLTVARSAVAGQAEHHHPDFTELAWQHLAKADGQTATAGTPGPVETTLLDLGVADTALLTRGAKIDHEAERLIIDAAVAADAHQRPARGLSRSASTAALVNHALRSEDPRAVALLRPPVRAQRELPEREP